MKKFINEHPKLYLAIVLLIAGLVFGIVTGIGCAKLEKAEAAITSDGASYPDLWSEVDWGEYADLKDVIKMRNDNLVVSKYVNAPQYRFNLTAGVRTGYAWDKYEGFQQYAIDNGDIVIVENNTVVLVVENAVQMPIIIDGGQYAHYPIASTYDYGIYLSNCFRNNISYIYVKSPVYLVNAPYLEYQSVESQSNYVNEKIHDIDEGYHIVNYKIMGQPMTPPDGYKVLYEYRVYLPTKEYFYKYLRDDKLIDLNGLNSMQQSIPKWRRNSVGSSDSKLWVFNLDRNIEAGKTNGDAVRIRLDYGDVLTELEEFNSVSLKEYYGFDDDMWDAYGKYIMAHLVVYRVDCIVYTLNTPDIYYGRNITVHFPPYLEKPIVTEYNGDYFNPDYDYDKEVDAKIEQALKDAKEESDKLLEEYKGMISNQENMFGSFDSEFADVGLWGALRGIGSGFLGLTGFITNFAVLVGGIFSFVPIAFQQYVGYTLLAILLIGLWKTIKG